MKISFVQNIFAPNEDLLNRQIKSIKSLENLNVDFYFSGWVAKPEYWDILDEHILKLNPKKYLKQNKNYGKAYNVNLLTSDLEDYDLLFTIDSDIILLEETDYNFELKRISEIENLGVVALNQKEGNCHLIKHLNKHIIINGQKYVWNNNSGGIAGGCLVIDFNFWKKINGYRIMGVYAGDDAYLFVDAKKHNKFFALNTDVSVIHPIETNSEYQKWKVKVCQRESNGKVKNDISNLIKESEEFWNNQK
jgi:hypothetical protein